jgi:hypothetical protein
MKWFSRCVGLSALASVSLFTACASNAPVALPETGATLTGTVAHKGKPVHFAMIIVQSVSGGTPATGNINPEGNYLVQNVPLGDVKVAVNTDAGQGDLMTARMQGGEYQGPDGKKKKRVSLDFLPVPKKFHTPDTSTITTTIKGGSNTFDIDVPEK